MSETEAVVFDPFADDDLGAIMDDITALHDTSSRAKEQALDTFRSRRGA